MTIKTAVVGVGSMGRNHARIYSELDESHLVAVCDTNQALATDVADRYNVDPYLDYWQMLSKAKPEAVSVAVPTALHGIIVNACIEAGAHVLVEKPISASISEGHDQEQQGLEVLHLSTPGERSCATNRRYDLNLS